MDHPDCDTSQLAQNIVQRWRLRRRLLPNLDTLCTRQIKGYSHQGRSVTMTHATAVITIDPLQGHGHTLHAQAFTSTCRRYSENHFTSDHPNLLPSHFLQKLQLVLSGPKPSAKEHPDLPHPLPV